MLQSRTSRLRTGSFLPAAAEAYFYFIDSADFSCADALPSSSE